MASVDPHASRPQGRIISLYHLDVHIEARRVGAAALDLLALLMIQTWINDVFGVTRVVGGAPFRSIGIGYAYVTTATTVDLPWLVLFVVVYFSVQEALFGATWGKLVAGLCVVDADGAHASLGAVLVRNILRPLDYWPAFYVLGAISAVLSPLRQRLGDRVAHTVVVRAESAPLAYRPPAEVRRRLGGLLVAVALFAALCLGFSYYGRPPLVVRGLVNIRALDTGRGIASYTLGTPRWSRNTVTYPLRYAMSHGTQSCRGSVTLQWGGFFALGGGWTLQRLSTRCQ